MTGEIDLSHSRRRALCARLRRTTGGSRASCAFSLNLGCCARRSTSICPRVGALNRPRRWCRLRPPTCRNCYRTRVSTAVLSSRARRRSPAASLRACQFPGVSAKGDDDLGGYHLVWPRDLVETGRRIVAAGRADLRGGARSYLDGGSGGRRPLAAEHVARRTGPIGAASRWTRRAFPILLIDLAAAREDARTERGRSLHGRWSRRPPA